MTTPDPPTFHMSAMTPMPARENGRQSERGVQPAVDAQNVSVSYNGTPALQDVSLQVPQRNITAIVGPSGCGKSSFLMALNRLTDLIPGCAVTGRLLVDGVDVLNSRLDVVEHRRRVGMISQQPNPFPLSIRRNVELPLKEHGLRNREQRVQRMERALRDVGLWDEVKDRLNSSARMLSGGQMQRLCLARALALKPDILLLDEPCSALDPLAAEVVEQLVLQLRNDYTIVVVTHNLAQAKRLADHIAVFWSDGGPGSLLEAGPAERLFDSPQHETTRLYLSGRRG